MIGSTIPVVHKTEQLGILKVLNRTIFKYRVFELKCRIIFYSGSLVGVHHFSRFCVSIDSGDRAVSSIRTGVRLDGYIGYKLYVVRVLLRRGCRLVCGRPEGAAACEQDDSGGYKEATFEHI